MILLLTDVGTTPGYGKYAGTYKVATELRANGFPTQVIDSIRFLGHNRIKKLIDKFVNEETYFIGISVTLLTGWRDKNEWGLLEEHLIDLIDHARSINPKVKIVVGGPQIDYASDWPYIDYAVINKGDHAAVALAKHLKYGDDLICKKGRHTIHINGDDYFYTQEEFATSKIVWQDNDIILPGEALPLELARGCIFKCSYCFFDLIGKKIGDWTKAENTLYEELMYNYERYGITQYMLADELVNESVLKLEALARVKQKLPFNFEYTSYGRIDMIVRYPQMIPLLKDSGAIGLAFGIETFHPLAGKAIGKGMDAGRIKDILVDCKEYWKDDVLVSANFIIGLPEEPVSSIMDTVDYLKNPDCPIDAFELNLLTLKESKDGRAGNKMGDDPEKYGYSFNKDTFEWESPIMTRTQGKEIMDSINADPFIANKRKFASATFIGRILGLGYSLPDVFDILNNEPWEKTRLRIRMDTNKKKEEYYQKLMSV